jgi:hypothetical protein
MLPTLLLLVAQADATLAIVTELVKNGVLGIVLAAVGLYAWNQSKELRKAESERTKDAQAVTQQLIALNDKWNAAVGALTSALQAQREMLDRLEELIRETKEALRNRR